MSSTTEPLTCARCRQCSEPSFLEELGMKTPLIVAVLMFVAGADLCHGQTSGNIAYSQTAGKAKAEQRQRSLRVLTKDELPPSATSMFVEANVLMNVKADEYVVAF